MDDNTEAIARGCCPTSYALSGKVMLISVLILLVVCVIIVFFHMYTRWFLLHRASRHHHHHLRRNRHLSVNSDPTTSGGFDPTLLKSLPSFLHSADDESPECAVCLSEFEEGEKGRVLPKCNHCFHLDCIDMWFLTHSNCPLCRCPVQPVEPPPHKLLETVIRVDEPAGLEAEPSSGLCPTCQMASSSLPPSDSSPASDHMKPPEMLVVTVDGDIDGVDLGSEGDNGSKTSGGPVLSIKRFLSI